MESLYFLPIQLREERQLELMQLVAGSLALDRMPDVFRSGVVANDVDELNMSDEARAEVDKVGRGYLHQLQYDFPQLEDVSVSLEYNVSIDGEQYVKNPNTDVHTDDVLRVLATISNRPDWRCGTYFFEGIPSGFVNQGKTLEEMGLSVAGKQLKASDQPYPMASVKVAQPENGQACAFYRKPHAAPILPPETVRIAYLFQE